MLVAWAQSTFITHDQLRIPSFVELVQNRCEIRNDSAPESRGSLRVVAHVAQWIERLPPEQKVVGPIPTVGARKEAQSTGVLDHGALVGLAIKRPSAPSAAILL